MNEEALLAAVKTAVNDVIESRLKEVIAPEIAEAARKLVEEMRLEKAVYGYDRSGLSDKEKGSLALLMKAAGAGTRVSVKSGEELIAEVDSRGGYLLPVEVAGAIERIAYSVGLALSQCKRWPMSSDQLDVPAYDGSVLTGAYLGLNAAGDITAVTFKDARLITATWQLAFAVSRKLLDLAPVALGEWLLALAGEALANMVDRQVFLGGSNAGDPFVGLLNSGDVTVQTLATGENTFEEYRIIEDSSIAIGNVEESVLGEAAFYFSRTVWANLRVQKDDNGAFLLAMAGQGSDMLARIVSADPKSPAGPKAAGSILSFPVFTCRHLPALTATAASTKFGVFGNLKAVGYGEKGAMRMEQYNSGTFGNKEIALAAQRGLVIEHEHAVAITLPAAINVVKTAAT